MTHEEHIREQGRLARALAEQRQALFAQVPFAAQLERIPLELGRMERPVMAVVGAEGVGKSALIQALGPELPWKWMELGAPTETSDTPPELEELPGPGLPVGEMAEHCLVVFAAGEPPSRDVLAWLGQLTELFPEGTLQVVLTRCDTLPLGTSPETARELLTEALRDAVPQRTLSVLTVSTTQPPSLEALRQALAQQLSARQHTLLEVAVKEWGTLLTDVRALLGMRELARVRPETLARLRLSLEELLTQESERLGGELPRLTRDIGRELEAQLPETEQRLMKAFREKFNTRMEPRREALRQRFAQTLTRELARDVEGSVPVELADRFGHLLEPEPLFFDWKRSKQVGMVGAGAAMLLGALRKKGAWMVIGTAVLGGVLAGLLSKGKRVRTAEDLQRVVAEPLLDESWKRLEQATQTCRGDIDRLCHLLRKVAEISSTGGAEAWDAGQLGQAVTQAEERRGQLDRELGELHWKHQLTEWQALADTFKTR